MKQLTDIKFICYPYKFSDGWSTLFQFYVKNVRQSGHVEWVWTEDKDLLEQALKKYPPEKFNWIMISEDEH